MVNTLNIREFPNDEKLKNAFLECLENFPEIRDENLLKLLQKMQTLANLTEEIDIIKDRNPDAKDPLEIEATDEFTEAPDGLIIIGGYLMAKMHIPGKIEIEGYNTGLTEFFTAVARNNTFSIYLPCTEPISYKVTKKKVEKLAEDPFGYIRCPECNAIIDKPDDVQIVQKDTKTYKIAREKPIEHISTGREAFCVRCNSYIGKEDEIIRYFKTLIDKKAFNVDFLKLK